MEMVHLLIEEESVARLRTGSFVPVFEIKNNGKSFPCNPEYAVKNAHLIFEGYSRAKVVGSLEISYEDKKNCLPSIIGFLHGKSLIIDQTNARDMGIIAEKLGIPVISTHANQVFLNTRHGSTMDEAADTSREL